MDGVFEVDSKSGDCTHDDQKNECNQHVDNILEDPEDQNDNSDDDPCNCASKHTTVFHCTACSKYFKSAQGCSIHERSRKHKNSVRTIENLLVEEVTSTASPKNTTYVKIENSHENDGINYVENAEENQGENPGESSGVKKNLLTVDRAFGDDDSNLPKVTRSNSLNLLSHVVKINVIEKIEKKEADVLDGY